MSGNDVSNLVLDSRNYESIGLNQSGSFSDDTIASFLNDELHSTLIEVLMETNEEYFVTSKDYTITPGSLGQIQLMIPSAATGLRLRDVYILSGGVFVNVPRLRPEQVGGIYFGYGNSNNVVNGFFLQGQSIQFISGPNSPISSVNTIRLTFEQTPAKLCLTTNACQIQSISGNNVLVSTIPSGWIVGYALDAIQNELPYLYVVDTSQPRPLYGADPTLQQFLIVAVSGTVITLDPTVIASLKVGQWLTTSGTSPFAQYIPFEAYPYLKQLAANKIIHAQGDREGEKMGLQRAGDLRASLLSILTPRVVGKPEKTINYNGIGRTGSPFNTWSY